MNIPIENLYYLLIYAWNMLEEADQVDVDVAGSTDLLDLLARVLNGGVEHLVRRGLDRAYVARSEEIPGIRGRLLISQSVAKLSFPQGRAWCQFDDLSHDVLHNQIVKSTLGRLLKASDLDKELRKQLRANFDRLGDVSVNRDLSLVRIRDVEELLTVHGEGRYLELLEVGGRAVDDAGLLPVAVFLLQRP